MKALTLSEPWATLMAIEAKRIETRSWKVAYRGELVIHAATKFHEEDRRIARTSPFVGYLAGRGFSLGSGLCVVNLVDVVSTNDPVRIKRLLAEHGAPHEAEFGNYGPDRYAWVTEFVRDLPERPRVRGRQGLWEWPL